jgi:hypothetical protein
MIPLFSKGDKSTRESRILLYKYLEIAFLSTPGSPLWKRGDRGDFGQA